MPRLPRSLPLVLGLSSAGALALAALSARSQTPSAYPSGYPSASHAPAASASASADASASGSASAKPPRALLRGADIPAEASEMPKDKKEWEAGKEVFENDGIAMCRFKLLREWLRMECENRIGGALLAGEPADVKVWSWGDPFAGGESQDSKLRGPPPMTVIVLPLRRGGAHIFDLSLLDSGGWDWVGPGHAERISITWRDGDDDPKLIVNGLR